MDLSSINKACFVRSSLLSQRPLLGNNRPLSTHWQQRRCSAREVERMQKLRVIKAQCYLILCSQWPVSWQFILHCQGHSNTGSMWILNEKKSKTQIISNFAKSKHKSPRTNEKNWKWCHNLPNHIPTSPQWNLKSNIIKYQRNSNEYWSYYSLKNLEKCVSPFPQKY